MIDARLVTIGLGLAIAIVVMYRRGRQEKKELRWGILGCGDVTEKKSGTGAFNVDGESVVVAVMRRNAALAQQYATRHGISTFFSDATSLIDDTNVDAIYIATPPGAHLSLALQVAAARKPCIIEKPMARNLAESVAMRDAFAAQGLPLFVAFYRRAYPRMLRLRALLDDGAIGAIREVHYTHTSPRKATPGWRVDANSSGGGLFVDVGSHALDLLDFLLGPLLDVSGHASGKGKGEVEERVRATFRFASGAKGTARWDFAAESHDDTLLVRGTKGSIRVPKLMNGDVIEVSREQEAVEHLSVPPPAVVQRPFVATVLKALRSGRADDCPSTAESALRTAAAMDTVLSAYYGGRADAFWERPQTWPGGEAS